MEPNSVLEEKHDVSLRSALLDVLRLGWPNSINQILTFIPGLVMLYLLGDNADQIAAAGMGYMLCNVTGMSLLMGSSAGSQPLISQAFGAKNYKRCGNLLQRQFAIHSVLVVIIALIWFFAEPILLACKQPAHISALAGQFAIWRIAALPAFAIKEDITIYLTAQRVMKLPMVLSILASFVNLICFYFFIPRFGFVGAPLAFTVANYFQGVALFAFMRSCLPEPDTWPVWSIRESLTGWGEMLKLALPGGLLMLCEWWGWETNLFFAGLLCDSESTNCLPLEVYPIVANTMVLAFMPNYGFGLGAGTLIGNALGANDPRRARQVATVELVLSASIGGFISLVLLISRFEWGWLFSQDEKVVSLTAEVIPVVAAYIFLDNMGPGALICILRSMNVVIFPAIMNFIAFYVIGIPFGLFLTFRLNNLQLGIIGLWTGLVLAMFIMVASFLCFLCCCVNWEVVAQSAHHAASTYTSLEGESEEPLALQVTIGKATDINLGRVPDHAEVDLHNLEVENSKIFSDSKVNCSN